MFSPLFRPVHLQIAMDQALDSLNRSQLPEALPVVLNRWYSDQPRTTTSRTLLIRARSHLKPEHASLLTPAHRENLLYELQRKRNDPYLVVAILRGFTGLRSPEALLMAKSLSEGQGCAKGFPAVTEAARVYLAAIEYV